MSAIQISSYHSDDDGWLLCEVVIRKKLKNGYKGFATWRNDEYYCQVGTSTNLSWPQQNTIVDWQNKVNDTPTWPKLDKDDKGGKWSIITPKKNPVNGGRQKVMYTTK